MLEAADIFRLHGAAYQARLGHRLPASHRRAMHDIQACRTACFGGHLKQCDQCGQQVYAYHSCRNRHCPKCHGDQTTRWLERQQARLLPCPYYLLTFTLPKELRALALRNPRQVYGLLMRSAVAALQELAADPRYVGARLGCLAVLHTWTRALLYHPHVHVLVTAGGLSAVGTQWMKPKNHAFLAPVRALSILFRAKLCAALKKTGLLEQSHLRSGEKTGSSIASPPEAAKKRSATWLATSFALPSATAAWSESTPTRSPSAIATTAANRCGGLPCPASSLSAVFSCMCSHRGAPRSVITG